MPLDYQVAFDVARFSADEGRQVIIGTRRRFFDGAGDQLPNSGCSVTRELDAIAAGHRQVAAMNRCLATMSAEIANVLIAL